MRCSDTEPSVSSGRHSASPSSALHHSVLLLMGGNNQRYVVVASLLLEVNVDVLRWTTLLCALYCAFACADPSTFSL